MNAHVGDISMAQNLDDFLLEAKEEIVNFEKRWREKNAENRDLYPLEMTDWNECLWWKFLHLMQGLG